ncbi:3-isopropylmalate dehydratase, small subunit [Thermanaerovibrio velox DSM 12556]|jgi:3-isopropylmalate/(R)-2-methylmalate dehydratase small subunit|uniref:3-isopropylmalate dehydratase small subunit n=1 Tax=Thermanaerovibrio velox DSM 12556 TaxID=926567 RepID=H0UPL4_9BACT|nr:3-isopropylmalate dehydratase [Thermanaerovibrio velox]EHM09561.1 3-isopropylmalate dehydratase, small subunit [Thermanaerovibrio velox DSM 12556]
MSDTVLRGRAWVFGDDVDTDLIYHNKYLAETDPKKMAQYSFEYYPGKENFAKEVRPGDFVVAGRNFGTGSSREHAVYCLKEIGVPMVLAESFARIYYRNAINNGYPVLFVKGLSDAIKAGQVKDGDELEVDTSTGVIRNLTQGVEFHGDAVTDLERDIMAAGGLIEYLKSQA